MTMAAWWLYLQRMAQGRGSCRPAGWYRAGWAEHRKRDLEGNDFDIDCEMVEVTIVTVRIVMMVS